MAQGLEHLSQMQERRAFAAEVCSAVDAEVLILGLLQASRGVDIARVRAVDHSWRSALARRYVYGSTDLQESMSQFDAAREATVLAIEDQDDTGKATAGALLAQARIGVLDAVQGILNQTNDVLAQHTARAAYPWWHPRHRRPVAPVALMPSRMLNEDE
jgi:hypothetical protein